MSDVCSNVMPWCHEQNEDCLFERWWLVLKIEGKNKRNRGLPTTSCNLLVIKWMWLNVNVNVSGLLSISPTTSVATDFKITSLAGPSRAILNSQGSIQPCNRVDRSGIELSLRFCSARYSLHLGGVKQCLEDLLNSSMPLWGIEADTSASVVLWVSNPTP